MRHVPNRRRAHGSTRRQHRVIAAARVAMLACLAATAGCVTTYHAPLRVATNLWPGYEPLYLAQAEGMLSADHVQFVEILAEAQVLAAYRRGTVDAAAVTLDEAIRLRDEGHDLVIVLVLDSSAGADALVARPTIGTVADLRGKRIGVEVGGVGNFVLDRALELAGLDQDAITIVPLAGSEQERAYFDGRVDAVVTYEPGRSALLRQGAHVVFDTTAIPNEVIDVLIVRPNVLSARRDDVDRVLAGWFAALSSIEQAPERAWATMSEREQISPADFGAMATLLKLTDAVENMRLLGNDGAGLEELAARLRASLARGGRLADANVRVPVDDGPLARWQARHGQQTAT